MLVFFSVSKSQSIKSWSAFKKIKLENVAIANALQLEAARRRAVPIRFNFVARAKFEVAQPICCRLIERFSCLYVTLRRDLEHVSRAPAMLWDSLHKV